MSRLNENAVVQLPWQIVAPAAGRREYLPATSLQIICQVVYRPKHRSHLDFASRGRYRLQGLGGAAREDRTPSGVVHLSRLILDLDGVTHMDSAGVGALLACLRDSEKQRVRFTFCGLPKPLHGMLESTHLSSLVEILPTVEETLRR